MVTLSEEVESPVEVKRSKSSPGGFLIIRKRVQLPAPGQDPKVVDAPVPTAWMLYDFAVNEHKLKQRHKKGVAQIVKHLLEHYAYISPEQKFSISVNGYASKSGTQVTNYNLATARAGNVRLELLLAGLPKNWIGEPGTTDNLKNVHLTPQQTDEWKRGANRSVLVILPTAFLRPPDEVFSAALRRRVWEDLNASKFSPADEKLFYPFAVWAIIVWDYLVKQKYIWLAGVTTDQNKHGMFFRLPESLTPWPRLRTVKEGRAYLSKLHDEFRAAWLRYHSNYTGAAGLGWVTDHFAAYQQSLRWVSLKQYASTSKVSWERLMVSMGYAEGNVGKLHAWAHTHHKGTAETAFFKPLNEYLKQHGIPCRVKASTPGVEWLK